MAENKKGKRLRGVYLVPDPLMMKPHFGPSEHIKVGLEQLERTFVICAVLVLMKLLTMHALMAVVVSVELIIVVKKMNLPVCEERSIKMPK